MTPIDLAQLLNEHCWDYRSVKSVSGNLSSIEANGATAFFVTCDDGSVLRVLITVQDAA